MHHRQHAHCSIQRKEMRSLLLRSTWRGVDVDEDPSVNAFVNKDDEFLRPTILRPMSCQATSMHARLSRPAFPSIRFLSQRVEFPYQSTHLMSLSKSLTDGDCPHILENTTQGKAYIEAALLSFPEGLGSQESHCFMSEPNAKDVPPDMRKFALVIMMGVSSHTTRSRMWTLFLVSTSRFYRK